PSDIYTLSLHDALPIFDQWAFLPPLLVAGIGLGSGFSAIFQVVLANVPPRDAGAGSGSLQAFQQVGGALGVAIVGELFFGKLSQDRKSTRLNSSHVKIS